MTTRSRLTTSRITCGQFSTMPISSSTSPALSISPTNELPSPALKTVLAPATIIRIGNVIHVIDFKFGSGVRVLALYPDGDDVVVNAQLMFYAVAARHTFPKFFAG